MVIEHMLTEALIPLPRLVPMQCKKSFLRALCRTSECAGNLYAWLAGVAFYMFLYHCTNHSSGQDFHVNLANVTFFVS